MSQRRQWKVATGEQEKRIVWPAGEESRTCSGDSLGWLVERSNDGERVLYRALEQWETTEDGFHDVKTARLVKADEQPDPVSVRSSYGALWVRLETALMRDDFVTAEWENDQEGLATFTGSRRFPIVRRWGEPDEMWPHWVVLFDTKPDATSEAAEFARSAYHDL